MPSLASVVPSATWIPHYRRKWLAKDLVGGYTIVEARDIDQAVDLSQGCPILDGGGSVEVRPVMKVDF